MRNLDTELLLLIFREVRRLETLPANEPLLPDKSNWAEPTTAFRESLYARHDLDAGFGIRVRPWFGTSPNARQRCARALRRLELAGLAERLTSGVEAARTTRVMILTAGRAMCAQLEAAAGPIRNRRRGRSFPPLIAPDTQSFGAEKRE